jgi:hypothetical protein
MEDQRNWADATLKSYCPPLAGPLPLHLGAGQSIGYELRFTAEGRADVAPRRARIDSIDLDPAPSRGVPAALPGLGMTHPGGRLPDEVVARLAEARPAFVHLLVDLGEDTWPSTLREDLSLVGPLCPGAVVTVDCPADRWDQLAMLGELGHGVIDTAFVFDQTSPITSPELAEAARLALDGSSIRVGAGTRGHFASLNLAGEVPEAAQVVAVALAAAAHDDDRRALTSGLESLAQIISQLRQLAGERELYVGPVGFAPTFDSWSPVGAGLSLRRAWDAAHHRHPTRFGGAWSLAALAALTPLGVPRVCLTGTVGGRGAGRVGEHGFEDYPILSLLRLLAEEGPGPYDTVLPGGRVGGLLGSDRAILAVMADAPLILGRTPGSMPGRIAATFTPGEQSTSASDGVLASPDVVVVSWDADPPPLSTTAC